MSAIDFVITGLRINLFKSAGGFALKAKLYFKKLTGKS